MYPNPHKTSPHFLHQEILGKEAQAVIEAEFSGLAPLPRKGLAQQWRETKQWIIRQWLKQ